MACGSVDMRKRRMFMIALAVVMSLNMGSVEGASEESLALRNNGDDMSISTATDGEVEAGHFGDYSDWIKKYHIGPHQPFQKQAKAKAAMPAKGAQKAGKVAHAASSAVVHHSSTKQQKQPKSTAQSAKAAKQPKADQHPAPVKSTKAKPAAARATKPAASADPAAALEQELAKLEGKQSTAAPKAAKKSKAESKHPSKAKVATKASVKVQGKHNLLSESSDTASDMSLDDLESSLKQLEDGPTALVQTGYTPSALDTKTFASDSKSDTVGAFYTIPQSQLSSSNFGGSVARPRAVGAPSPAGLPKQRKVTELKVPRKPKAMAAKLHKVRQLVKRGPSKKKVSRAKLDAKLKLSEAKVESGLKSMHSEKAKISAMLDKEAHHQLARQHTKKSSFEAQLDQLEETAASDAEELDQAQDYVQLLQEGESTAEKSTSRATQTAKAPDMIAQLAAKFKKKEHARRDHVMEDVRKDEDKKASKEADEAMKFQMEYTKAETSNANKRAKQGEPKTLEEAMAPTKRKLQPGEHKVGKGSVNKIDKAVFQEAKLAKAMTSRFMSYQKKLQKQRKKQQSKEAAKVTKGSLKALFKSNGDTKTASSNLGEASGTRLPDEDKEAMKFAQAMLQNSQSNVAHASKTKQRKEEAKDDKSRLASMFGIEHKADGVAPKQQKSDRRQMMDARKKMLGEADRQALEMQKMMTQRSMQNQGKPDDEAPGEDEGSIASLFAGKTEDKRTTLGEAQKTAQQDFQQQQRFQKQMLHASQRQSEEQSQPDIKMTKSSINSLFKGNTANRKQDLGEHLTPDAKQAVQLQRQFTKNMEKKSHTHDMAKDKAATKENIESLFKASGKLEGRAQQARVGNAEKAQQLRMLEQTRQRSLSEKAELGENRAVSHAAVEDLFRGKVKRKLGRFAYMPSGKRKKLMNEFADSATRQANLLQQMQNDQLSRRSEVAIEERAAHSKWDELAYQNKLRGLFGAAPIKKQSNAPLTHKKAVSKFDKQVREAQHDLHHKRRSKHQVEKDDSDEPLPFEKDALVETKEGTAVNTRQKFGALIQEEAAQFNKLASGKQGGKSGHKTQKLLASMLKRFNELKDDNAQTQQSESFVEEKEGQSHEAKEVDVRDQIRVLNHESRAKVLHDVKETVLNDKSSAGLHSSMLARLTKMFRDAE